MLYSKRLTYLANVLILLEKIETQNKKMKALILKNHKLNVAILYSKSEFTTINFNNESCSANFRFEY